MKMPVCHTFLTTHSHELIPAQLFQIQFICVLIDISMSSQSPFASHPYHDSKTSAPQIPSSLLENSLSFRTVSVQLKVIQTAAAARREEDMPKVEVLQSSGADKPCPPVKRSQKSKFMAMADLPTPVRYSYHTMWKTWQRHGLRRVFPMMRTPCPNRRRRPP